MSPSTGDSGRPAMDDDEAIEGLKRLGLTTYESRVFLALQKLGHGTASEISDVEDVPRSQVYGAAEGLEQRGLVETQQSTPTVYRPIPLDQARTLLLEQLAETGSETFNYLDSIQNTTEQQEQSESIWLINTQESIVSRVVEIIEGAEQRVLYGADRPYQFEDQVVEALTAAAENGVSVVMTSANEAALANTPEGDKFQTLKVPAERDMDVSTGRVLVVDGHTILLSTLTGDGQGTDEVAFWTSDNPFASVLVELIEAWLQTPGRE